MAKKKRRPRQNPQRASTASVAGRDGPDPRTARRSRKDEARQVREAALRRTRRRSTARRAAAFGAVAAAALGALLLLGRAGGPRAIPDAALQAARTARCGKVQTPAASAPGNLHLASGAPYQYDQHPATSGYHDPAPLPAEPHVYASPVPETNAVHNLEHGYVLIYYRQDGDDALPPDAVSELETLANSESKVIIAPYPQLPAGTSLALAAWNKLWECPSTISSNAARTVASGFISAYRGTSNAPEGNAP